MLTNKDFKITQRKSERINFRYNGKHYSLNKDVDGYESVINLRCKEDKDFVRTVSQDDDFFVKYFTEMKRGQTHKNTNYHYLYYIIRKYIDSIDPDSEMIREQ